MRFITQKPFIFKFVFEAQKTPKTDPNATKKRQKTTPECIKHDFHEQSIFVMASLRKPRFWSPKRRNFDAELDKKMTQKQARNKNEMSSFLNSENGYTQVQKSPQNKKKTV